MHAWSCRVSAIVLVSIYQLPLRHYVFVFHLPTSASEPSPMQQVTSTVLGLSVTLVTVVIMLVAVIVGTVSLIAYVTHLKKKQGRQNPPLYS